MNKIKGAVLIMLFLLLLYALIRILFYLFFYSHLGMSTMVLGRVLYWGMRIDFSSLFYINIPFLVYYLFISEMIAKRCAVQVGLAILLVLNLPFLALNVIDLAYYGFTSRRSTIDLWYVTVDSLTAVPQFLKTYWYLLLLFIIDTAILFWGAKKILTKFSEKGDGRFINRCLPGRLLLLLFFAGIARGWQARPLLPSTPLLYFDPQYQPLVLNSSFTFLYSLIKRQEQLTIKKYYNDSTLDSIFTIRRQYVQQQPFQRKNVVVFILESFCREYFENGSPYRAKTPFLDSIISKSTWCSHAFSNGIASNQGIVSILASLPPLLDEPYYHSRYSNNKLRALGTILKEQGYTTHFFMGAGADHFGFGKFCRMGGIDHYYSRKDFNDDRYYDGTWGIYDHRFLPFGAGILQKQANPFLAVFFNLSSHYPFAIPAELLSRFDFPGQQPFQKSAAYVDYSLQLFFNQIKHTAWYRNTIFVFTADHSLLGYGKNTSDPYTSFRIPIFIFDPSLPEYREIKKPVQQIDVVPTILHKLAYRGAFMSFGRSIYDTSESYAINKFHGVVQAIDTGFIFGYNPETNEPVYLYRTSGDSSVKINLLNNPADDDIRKRLLRFNKAFQQRYNNSLIYNRIF